ncbi:MAG: SDR family NAD(P)-dependent oxidoreductase [Myxococcota bacterium]
MHGRQKGWSVLWPALGLGAFAALRMVRRRAEYADKVVLISGGSRGLGLVMARQFAEQGARLALSARNARELERAGNELRARGATVSTHVCDVTDRTDVMRMVQEVRQRHGRVDVLCNVAGIITVGPQESMTLADYDDAMNVHFWGPLYTMLAVVDEMKRRGSGLIINISSIGGKLSVPHMVPYSASKFALVGLSEGMRAELARSGIHVLTVCPGLMRTGSADHAYFKGRNRAEYTWFSLSAGMPLLTMSAERAAAQILKAARQRRTEVVLSLPALVGARMANLFPDVTGRAMALTNRFLPTADGEGRRRFTGRESHGTVTPSLLTRLNDQAAARNNEL